MINYSLLLIFTSFASLFTSGCGSHAAKNAPIVPELLCTQVIENGSAVAHLRCWYLSPEVADDTAKLNLQNHQLAAQMHQDLKGHPLSVEAAAIYSVKNFNCDSLQAMGRDYERMVNFMSDSKPRVMLMAVPQLKDTIDIIFFDKNGEQTGRIGKWVGK